MCVIVAVMGDKRPSESVVKACWDNNDHGGGFAWREGEGKKKVVRWTKGITQVEEMVKAAATLPIPYVLHFRIASCGGKNRALTHPFILSAGPDQLELQGAAKDLGVLFHNGHLSNWEHWLTETAQRSGGKIKIPSGPWSDTRAMAYLASVLGVGMLEIFDEKLVHFTPERCDLYSSKNQKWKLIEGIHYSNDFWEYRVKRGSYSGVVTPSRQLPSHYSGPERADAVAPFREARKDPPGGDGPVPPKGLSKKAAKRWRRRMEAKGLLPKGEVRHKKRQGDKYTKTPKQTEIDNLLANRQAIVH